MDSSTHELQPLTANQRQPEQVAYSATEHQALPLEQKHGSDDEQNPSPSKTFSHTPLHLPENTVSSPHLPLSVISSREKTHLTGQEEKKEEKLKQSYKALIYGDIYFSLTYVATIILTAATHNIDQFYSPIVAGMFAVLVLGGLFLCCKTTDENCCTALTSTLKRVGVFFAPGLFAIAAMMLFPSLPSTVLFAVSIIIFNICRVLIILEKDSCTPRLVYERTRDDEDAENDGSITATPTCAVNPKGAGNILATLLNLTGGVAIGLYSFQISSLTTTIILLSIGIVGSGGMLFIDTKDAVQELGMTAHDISPCPSSPCLSR